MAFLLPYVPLMDKGITTSRGGSLQRFVDADFLYKVDTWNFHDGAVDSRLVSYSEAGTNLFTGGAVTLVAGANLDDAASLNMDAFYYKGDTGFVMNALITLPADITPMKIEVGMVSDITTSTAETTGQIGVKATPTDITVDYAVFIYDTDDDGEWGFIGAKAANIESVDLTEFTPAVSTQYLLSLVCQPNAGVGDVVTGYINGKSIGAVNIEGGTLMSPNFLCIDRDTDPHNLVINKLQMIEPASTNF